METWATYWHSSWGATVQKPPHWITISKSDLSAFSFGAIQYTSREVGGTGYGVRNGTALEVKVYVSNDGTAFTQVAHENWFANRDAVAATVAVGERLIKTITVEPGVTAKYVRFEIVRGTQDNGGPAGDPNGWGHAAEINLSEWVTPAS